MDIEKLKNDLVGKNLKVTAQRLFVYQTVLQLKNHPTVEQIIESVRKIQPTIAVGTVYNILDLLVDNQLIRRVKTQNGATRFDGIMRKHHHLYDNSGEEIVDYFDEDLNQLLYDYFEKKKIDGFEIEDISLHIKGKLYNKLKN